MRKCLHAIVHGEVQGVSFRDFTRGAAKELGLTGTVRNCPNRAVEVVAEGEEFALLELLRVLHDKHPFAKVERIDEVWSEATGEFGDFHIAR